MAEHLIDIEETQKDLLSCAAFLAEGISSSDGHAAALSEIIPRYIEKGDVDLAAQLANSIDDPFARDKLLMRVAEKCAAIDDDEYAFQLVDAIEDQGSQSMARERIALQKSAKNETAKALEIVENLSHPDDAFADIALHQIIQNDESSAMQTLERIDFPASRATAFQNIGVYFQKEGNSEKATEFFELAVGAAKDIEYYEEKIRALGDVANQFIEIGNKERALELFEDARIFAERIDGVHRDGFLARIAVGFLNAGSIESADQTLDLVADNTQVASCLLGFSRIFAANGDAEEAVETLDEAYQLLKSQRDQDIRDSQSRFSLLGAVAVQFARFEKPERALEIAQENIDEMQQLSALSQIAQVSAALGNDESTKQTLNAIFEDSTRMFTLIGISDAKNSAGDKENSLKFLDEARELCESVPQLASRSEALSEFAVRYQQFGDTEKARKMLHENLDTISQIKDETNRAVNLAKLAMLYEKYDFNLTDAEKAILKEMVRKAEVF